MSESLVRSPSDVIGASCTSLVTPRTFGTPCTIFSTSARTASSGTSPVISVARLNAATLTWTLSAKRPAMRHTDVHIVGLEQGGELAAAVPGQRDHAHL